MGFPFVEQNSLSRARLQAVADRLSDADLALTTPYGWTIAGLLAHLAWWDQRVLVLLRRWKEKGIDESPVDSQAVNDALKPLCHAIEPRRAIALCLASANAVDAELETIRPDFVERIEATATQFRFNRALHRNDHLQDIEALLRS
jgi:DinB superfamily